MTNFMKKRLEYFKKAALNGDTVRLGKEDFDMFSHLENLEMIQTANKLMDKNKELFESLAKLEEEEKCNKYKPDHACSGYACPHCLELNK